MRNYGIVSKFPQPERRGGQFTENPVFQELGAGGERPLVQAADYAPKRREARLLGLRWEKEADSRAETFAPILGLVLAALLDSQLYLRMVHQTLLHVLSERPAHSDKGFVEVRKPMGSSFRRRYFRRAHSDGNAQWTLHQRRGLLQHSAVPILQ